MPGLQVYQRQTLEGKIQLPLIQRIGRAVSASLLGSMMTDDALRRAGTSGTGTAKGPLPAVQVFTRGELGPNAPASMQPGILRTGTYKAGVGQGRGQSQGV